MHKSWLPLCGLCVAWAAAAVAAGAVAAVTRAGPDIVAEATPLAAELAKPRYSQSRCMVGAVLADDGRTVIKSTDPQFASGDRVLAVDGDPLEEKSATAFIGLLEHRAPDAQLEVTVARDGAARALRVRCADARPYYALLQEAAGSAVSGDAATCDDRIAAAARLHGLSSIWMRLAMSCRIRAGRLSGRAMWQTDFELYAQRIDEAQHDPQQLQLLRHAIVGAARDLAASGNVPLADSLHRHYAAALGDRPEPDPP